MNKKGRPAGARNLARMVKINIQLTPPTVMLLDRLIARQADQEIADAGLFPIYGRADAIEKIIWSNPFLAEFAESCEIYRQSRRKPGTSRDAELEKSRREISACIKNGTPFYGTQETVNKVFVVCRDMMSEFAEMSATSESAKKMIKDLEQDFKDLEIRPPKEKPLEKIESEPQGEGLAPVGKLLGIVMKERALNVEVLAGQVDLPPDYLQMILDDNVEVTSDVAERLEIATSIPVYRWLGFASKEELWESEEENE